MYSEDTRLAPSQFFFSLLLGRRVKEARDRDLEGEGGEKQVVATKH